MEENMKQLIFTLVFIFACALLLSTPTAFYLISPLHSSLDVDIWPTFMWQQSTSTTDVSYNVHISTDENFSDANTVVYEGVPSTQFRPSVDLVMGNTVYFWKVQAIDQSGQSTWATTLGSQTGYWMFSTIPASSPRLVNGSVPMPYNRTLIPQNTPYTLSQGNLVIQQNHFFEIRAGVELKIDGVYCIEVQGEIRTMGTASNRVTITTASNDPQPGFWQDIRFSNTASPSVINADGNYINGSVFMYTDFHYAGSSNSLIYSPNTRLYIDNCVLGISSNQGGIYIGSNGGGGSVISNSSISGFTKNTNLNGTGNHGGGIFIGGDNNRIIGNTISNCAAVSGPSGAYGGGIYANGSNNVINNNEISFCSTSSSTTYASTSPVNSFGGGLYINGSNNVITNNDISSCNNNSYADRGNSSTHSYGGGLYSNGSGNVMNNNVFSSCSNSSQNSMGTYTPISQSFGGGLYSNGSGNEINNNEISTCSNSSAAANNGSSSSYGGGLYSNGADNEINNNEISTCSNSSIAAINTNMSSYGGGLYSNGSNIVINNNEISSCYSYSSGFHSNSSYYSCGGGLYFSGSGQISDNLLSDNSLPSGSAGVSHLYGAGAYITGTDVMYAGNAHLNNNSNDGLGGGLFMDVAESQDNVFNGNLASYGGGIFLNVSNATIDACTITNNSATINGGGIYVNATNATIDACTITSNTATTGGGGIYGGKVIKNSIVKYNAGGIYTVADTDSIYNNNISHNSGFQVEHSSANNVNATNNWWHTRVDMQSIEAGIWHQFDAAALGYVSYLPFLTEPSPTVPGVFHDVTYIVAKSDSTYSTLLNSPVNVGDTLYIEIGGIDSNPYNSDVTVISVVNLANDNQIRPFFDETGNNTGIFRGSVILSNSTQIPNQIAANSGHQIRFSSEADPDFYFDLTVGSYADLLYPPRNLTASIDDDSVLLDWEAPINSRTSRISLRTLPVSGYNIYRNGTQINQTLITGTSYTDPDILYGQSYTYQITALYAQGESEVSNDVTVTYAHVNTPFFSPAPQATPYTTTLTVEISSTTLNATIWHKTAESAEWIEGNTVEVTQTTSIWAKATLSNWIDSETSYALYTLKAVSPSFTPSPQAEPFNNPIDIALYSTTMGSTIMYRLTPSVRLERSAQITRQNQFLEEINDPVSRPEWLTYNTPIHLGYNTDTMIEAKTIKDGWQDSDIVTNTYVVYPGQATITITNTNQVYNGNPLSVSVETNPAGLVYSVTYDGSPTIPVNAGQYEVLVTIIDTLYIGNASTTFTISPLGINVVADAQSKTYGEADPELTFTNTPDLIGTDQFTGSLTRDAGEDVGVYDILQGSLSLGNNYQINYTSADLTVVPFEADVTIVVNDIAYGYPLDVSVSIDPQGLDYLLQYYNGDDTDLTTPLPGEPSAPGNYIAAATIDELNYIGIGQDIFSIIELPVPTGLSATAGDAVVSLSWDAVQARGQNANCFDRKLNPFYRTFLGYNVYRDGTLLTNQAVTDLFYEDTSVFNGTQYQYCISSLFELGESQYSDVISVTPLAAPSNLVAEIVDDNSVNLQWSLDQSIALTRVRENSSTKVKKPTRTELTGFNIYRDDDVIYTCQASATSYLDEDLETGTYTYHITAIYGNMESVASNSVEVEINNVSIEEEIEGVITTALLGNYPNPFNPSTTICFSLKEAARVNISIFNIKGQRVKSLLDGEIQPGHHAYLWDGTDNDGRSVSSGVFYYTMKTPIYQSTRKMIMLK